MRVNMSISAVKEEVRRIANHNGQRRKTVRRLLSRIVGLEDQDYLVEI